MRLARVVIAFCCGLSWAVGAQSAEGARKKFDLPAGTAPEALQQFSAQAGGRLLYPADIVDGVRTREVRGEFTPRDALDRMLTGTGLEIAQDERSGALVIRRQRPQKEKPRSATLEAAPQPSVSLPDEAVQMSTFTIRSERDPRYVGRTALSSTRMGTSLANLPQSVRVLNRTFLDDVNPTILANALTYVGGAQPGTINWSVDRYMIRGFVGEGDYVDGFRTQTDRNSDLHLIDHVEIIKGPAAIFTANQAATVGGVINKITKSPTDYRVGAMTVQLGLWDSNRADVDIGGPVSPAGKLQWRLLAAGQDTRGYYDFTYEKRTSLLPMLAYRFSERAEVWLKFQRFSSHYSSYNGVPLDGRTGRMAAVPRTTNYGEATPLNWRTDQFTRTWSQLTLRPSEWLAVRVAAFDSHNTQRRVESVLVPQGTVTPLERGGGIFAFLPHPQYVIPPHYRPGTLLPRELTAIDADERTRREVQNDYVFTFTTRRLSHRLLIGGGFIDYPETVRTFSSGPTSTASASAIDPLHPTHPGMISLDLAQPPANTIRRTQTFAKAYVLETASLFHERLVFSLGGTRNRFALSTTSFGYNQVTQSALPPTVVPKALLYKSLLQYGVVAKPVPHLAIFYGYNSNFSANPIQFGQFLPPQEGEQREAGLKAEWLNGAVSVSLSRFVVTQQNNIVAAFPQTTPPSQVLVPGTVSRGWDGDFTIALGSHFDVVGSFALLRARVPLPEPWRRAIQPYDGKIHGELPVNNGSERNFAAWTRYKFTRSPLRGLAVGVGFSYLARRAITDNRNLVFYGYVPARTLIDAAVYYETPRTKFQLNIDNVTDRPYIYAARSNLTLVPGTPLNLRASLVRRF